ncbi:MAG: hypothetical protein LBB14_00825 [Puniceicoccales bacterium]|nr:hypothetical protein [Puniceicoccales bacterium]
MDANPAECATRAVQTLTDWGVIKYREDSPKGVSEGISPRNSVSQYQLVGSDFTGIRHNLIEKFGRLGMFKLLRKNNFHLLPSLCFTFLGAEFGPSEKIINGIGSLLYAAYGTDDPQVIAATESEHTVSVDSEEKCFETGIKLSSEVREILRKIREGECKGSDLDAGQISALCKDNRDFNQDVIRENFTFKIGEKTIVKDSYSSGSDSGSAKAMRLIIAAIEETYKNPEEQAATIETLILNFGAQQLIGGLMDKASFVGEKITLFATGNKHRFRYALAVELAPNNISQSLDYESDSAYGARSVSGDDYQNLLGDEYQRVTCRMHFKGKFTAQRDNINDGYPPMDFISDGSEVIYHPLGFAL